jgi:hypothetical protein
LDHPFQKKNYPFTTISRHHDAHTTIEIMRSETFCVEFSSADPQTKAAPLGAAFGLMTAMNAILFFRR